jgi:CPA1 family monovalent cation:H+ antiporter
MLGGLIIGIGIGLIVARLLRAVDNHLVETTITVCVAYGVYLLAVLLQTSGLLAVVGAGLVLGSYGQRVGLSDRARQASQEVWEFLSYLVNSLLFLLLGIQIGESNLLPALTGIGLALIGVIIGRALMIYLLLPLQDVVAHRVNKHKPIQKPFFSWPLPLPLHWRPIFLLSGLRGALSIALVLSLPSTLPNRNLLEVIVYGVVLITLLGQGVGLRVLLPRWKAKHEEVL